MGVILCSFNFFLTYLAVMKVMYMVVSNDTVLRNESKFKREEIEAG